MKAAAVIICCSLQLIKLGFHTLQWAVWSERSLSDCFDYYRIRRQRENTCFKLYFRFFHPGRLIRRPWGSSKRRLVRSEVSQMLGLLMYVSSACICSLKLQQLISFVYMSAKELQNNPAHAHPWHFIAFFALSSHGLAGSKHLPIFSRHSFRNAGIYFPSLASAGPTLCSKSFPPRSAVESSDCRNTSSFPRYIVFLDGPVACLPLHPFFVSPLLVDLATRLVNSGFRFLRLLSARLRDKCLKWFM